jgi:hypothetical protein
VKSHFGYYFVLVTLFDPTAYDAVRVRTDKLMSAASVKTISKQK